MACKENIFFYHFALPEIFEEVRSLQSIGTDKAREAIRCEYFEKFPHLSSGNTRRIQGHPFSKTLQMDPKKVMEKWKKPGTRPNEAYPDMSLTSPFPFTIVFDAKFFVGESISSAEMP